MKRFTQLSTLVLSLLLLGCSESIVDVQNAEKTEEKPAVKEIPDQVVNSGDLSGLYKKAKRKAPIVLIVPGSGPTDLNGNSPSFGIVANAYSLLAQGLGERGISTVRVDKRGMFSSAAAGDGNAVTVDIYAQDYSNWIETIRTETKARCVYLLGHSEGALMVSAAAKLNENVCGLILVSGMGRKAGDVLREQLEANPGNVLIMDDAMSAIDKLEKGEKVDVSEFHPALQGLFNPAVQGFIISLMQTDPAQIAKDANIRTLIVQGETDIQTSVEDAKLLAEATQGKLVIIEGVNHVLKESTRKHSANRRTYTNPDLPISERVVDEIADFVLE
jgi:pimeloyl-ACP methyl ester carboxylesterase